MYMLKLIVLLQMLEQKSYSDLIVIRLIYAHISITFLVYFILLIKLAIFWKKIRKNMSHLYLQI